MVERMLGLSRDLPRTAKDKLMIPKRYLGRIARGLLAGAMARCTGLQTKRRFV